MKHTNKKVQKRDIDSIMLLNYMENVYKMIKIRILLLKNSTIYAII